jgi:hypothetical protein
VNCTVTFPANRDEIILDIKPARTLEYQMMRMKPEGRIAAAAVPIISPVHSLPDFRR